MNGECVPPFYHLKAYLPYPVVVLTRQSGRWGERDGIADAGRGFTYPFQAYNEGVVNALGD